MRVFSGNGRSPWLMATRLGTADRWMWCTRTVDVSVRRAEHAAQKHSIRVSATRQLCPVQLCLVQSCPA